MTMEKRQGKASNHVETVRKGKEQWGKGKEQAGNNHSTTRVVQKELYSHCFLDGSVATIDSKRTYTSHRLVKRLGS